MTTLTHEKVQSDRLDRAADRHDELAKRYHHEVALRSSLEASIRNLAAYKHMTRDQLADYLLAAIDRAHLLADQLCPLPVEVDVLEGNARTGVAA
jgi:hypothetical protein